MCGHVPYLVSLMSKPQHVYQNQADPQAFEHLLMTEPLFTVRDLGVGLADTGDKELLRNYAFNISQGIVQRVSRYFDALALMDERGEAPPARGEGGKYADSARGGVMGFGHKRNVGNQEKKPARRVAWEQQVDPAVKAERERIQKAAEEEAAEMKIQIAEMRSENERNRREREEAVTVAKAKAVGQQADPAMMSETKRKAAPEQDAEMAAPKAQVAELQAPTAPSAALRLLFEPYYAPPLRATYARLSLLLLHPPAHMCMHICMCMYHLQAKEQRTKEPEELKLEIIIKAEQAACPTLRTSAPSPPHPLHPLHTLHTLHPSHPPRNLCLE